MSLHPINTMTLLPFRIIFLITLFIALSSARIYPEQNDNLYLRNVRDGQTLTGSTALHYLPDDHDMYNPSDINGMMKQMIPWTSDTIDLGRTTNSVWFDFTLQNKTLNRNWILDFNIHKFLTVELYRESYPGRYILENNASYKDSFFEREISEARLAFPLQIQPGSSEHYIMKVRSENGLVLPLRIYTENQYTRQIYKLNTLWAVFYSITAVMVLYNLMIWLFIRDKNYLYYVIYVVLNMLYLSALNGAGAQFLWPGVQGRWTTVFSPLFGGITLAFGIQLCRTFLGGERLSRTTNQYLNILIVLSLVLSVSNLIIEKFMIPFTLGNILGALIMLSIIGLTLKHIANGNKPALLFLFSYLVIVLGQLGYSVKALGYFDGLDWLLEINQYTPILQVTLLSLALSYRISVIREEKDQARAAALEAETILTEKLEEKVNERTLELRVANDRLRDLSDKDGLTALYNRRFFDTRLKAEWSRHRRSGLSLALIFCDIDHFKMYNDTAGHQEGDECLKKIASVLAGNARREADIAARYGGEEFAIIIPQMEMKGALRIAQNIQNEIRDLKIPHPAFAEQSGIVTMSFGIATIIPSDEKDAGFILNAADQALYESKRAGRDTITPANI